MRTQLTIFLISISLLLSFGSAQAETDIEALAKSLREQINSLQEQILKLQKEMTSASQKLTELEQAIEFDKDLRSGTESEEVKNLQQFLSQYPDIYPEGRVTGFFGPLTEQAIKKFQEKYSDDILKPFGLTKATGFVGPSTRAKLNELAKATPVTPAVPAAPATPAAPAVPIETPAVPAVPAQPATTTPDITAPANVTNLTLAPTESLITVSWKNPTDSDFSGTKLIQKMWNSPTSIFDGTEIYNGLATSTINRGIINGLSYCYKAFTYDEVPNYSTGIGGCATPTSTTTIVPIVVTPSPTPTPTPTPTVDTTAPVMSNFQPTGTTTDTTPTLSLSTNESANCKYASATDQSYDSMASTFTSTGGTSHSVTVGLLATATYTYYARCQDIAGNKNTSSISTTFAVDPSAPDTAAPIISSIQATGITTSSATVSWSTNEESTSVVEYGLTTSYGSTASGATNVISHQISLANLASSTVYNYRVKSTDIANNQAQSSNQTFTTLTPTPADTTPPASASNFSATAGNGQITLSWTNPVDSDFAGVKILRNTISFTSITDGTQVYSGTAASFTDTGLTNGTTYYYRVFTYDQVPNYSYYGSGATATPVAPISSGTPQFILKWGSLGSGDGQFNSPYSIAIDASGNVYVADYYGNRVQKFTSDGTFITKWGSQGSGDGQFNSPHGIAIDASGNVYVTDTSNYRVQKFTSNGTFITKWGSGDGQFNYPLGITVDASGNVYVTENNNHRVQKFTSNGTFITKWGSQGSGDGQFNSPHGIAIDASGNVYVTDTSNYRVQKFTSNGTLITKWGSQGSGGGQFNYPIGITVDASGNVYVAESNNHRVQKFTSDGTFITTWGSQGSGDGQFFYPYDVAIDASGNVYVTDTSNLRIQKFSSGQTAFLEYIQSQLAAISAAVLELLKR